MNHSWLQDRTVLMNYSSTFWQDPSTLDTLGSYCQWIAIALVFLGGIAQVVTLALKSKRETIPAAEGWSHRLQWLAVILVFLGVIVQVATQQIDKKEKVLRKQVETISRLHQEAIMGSRGAYQQLVSFAATPGSFQNETNRRLRQIRQQLLTYRDIPAVRTDLEYTVARNKVSLKSLTAVQLFDLLARPSSSELMRQSLMTYILEKPKAEVLCACDTVLQKFDSLPACAAACGVLARVLGNRADFLDFKAWREVCQSEIAERKGTDTE